MLEDILREVHYLEALSRERRDAVARSCGLSRAAWRLLRAASERLATVSHHAKTLAQSRQGVQRVADGLVEKGLASYVPNPYHRRSPRLQLTERGRSVLASLERSAARREWDVGQDIELEELETTLYVLRALRERM